MMKNCLDSNVRNAIEASLVVLSVAVVLLFAVSLLTSCLQEKCQLHKVGVFPVLSLPATVPIQSQADIVICETQTPVPGGLHII